MKNIKKDWNSISERPPDELVEVMDENRNIAKAFPTYYPFKTDKKGNLSKYDVTIIPARTYWDGGWMIACEGLHSNINSQIVKWRKLLYSNNQK